MVEKRFHTLRFLGTLCKLFAVLFLIVGILGFLSGALFATALNTNLMAGICWYPACNGIPEPAGSLVVVTGGFIIAFMMFLAFFGLGEFIGVMVAIEENTRRVAFILRMGFTPQAQPTAPIPLPPTTERPPDLAPEKAG